MRALRTGCVNAKKSTLYKKHACHRIANALTGRDLLGGNGVVMLPFEGAKIPARLPGRGVMKTCVFALLSESS